MTELASVIDLGWNIGFYTTLQDKGEGIRPYIYWRAKMGDKELKSARGFLYAQDCINDFCIEVRGKEIEIT